MKRSLITAIAALFISSGWINSVAPASTRNSLQENDSISTIRQRYAIINKNLAKYRVVKKELSGFSTEGGELTAYYDGTAIVKIATLNQGETGRSFEDFYYWNGKLMFVFRRQDTYDTPLSGKVVKSRENRFYFSDDKLIRWINENGTGVTSRDSKYTETQVHYLNRSKLFTEGARAKVSLIEAPDFKL